MSILDPACVSISPKEPDPPEVVLRLDSKRVMVEAEPHHHSYSKVCRVLMHSFRVVQAQRTYTNHTITVLKVCRALVRGC